MAEVTSAYDFSKVALVTSVTWEIRPRSRFTAPCDLLPSLLVVRCATREIEDLLGSSYRESSISRFLVGRLKRCYLGPNLPLGGPRWNPPISELGAQGVAGN